MTKKSSTVLIIAVLAAALAGCSGGGGGGDPAASASAGANRQQLLALGQQWVQCVRDHGLPRMPDAQLSQDGYLEIAPTRGYDWKNDLAKHRSIIEACQSIEDSYPPNAFRPKEQYSAEDLRKLAAYAKCARAHGIPDWPDPDTSGAFDVTGTSMEHGVSGRLRDQIDEACKSIWSGNIKLSGGSGGKK
ncbi:hypothetical protein ACQP2F_12125 [Actinoplanes sp. CA-030573]|uniref:hypothetical protein n=1 Tax=Actinoplanes sp. CA-030573 TaxID=3239898 RepID=UPI003D9083A9